ncbi:MAG TPA: hypothetical protein ENJ95_06835 [Bacteroidetes bacterium]|nr:hypothetical protein [Bacteroidota bacterium]
MDVAELQIELIKYIVHTNDSDFLQQLLQAIKSYRKGEDWWERIFEKEKEAIEIGIQQLDNGEGIPHEEVRKEINKRLGLIGY